MGHEAAAGGMPPQQKEDQMANWGDGYQQGYNDATKKHLGLIDIIEKAQHDVLERFKDNIQAMNRDLKGNPSQYAVAHKCCGGVDAHDVGCRG